MQKKQWLICVAFLLHSWLGHCGRVLVLAWHCELLLSPEVWLGGAVICSIRAAGWAAAHRLPLHLCSPKPSATLPSGTWSFRERTQTLPSSSLPWLLQPRTLSQHSEFSLCVPCLNLTSAEQLPLAFCGFWRERYCSREVKQLPPPLARCLLPSSLFPLCYWLSYTCLSLLVLTCRMMHDVLVVSVLSLCFSVYLLGVIFIVGIWGALLSSCEILFLCRG